MISCETHSPGHAMLMRHNEAETVVHDCHSTGSMLAHAYRFWPNRGDVLCDHCFQIIPLHKPKHAISLICTIGTITLEGKILKYLSIFLD